MRDTTAKETADCLMDFFGRYGFADEILTDGGSQFINETVQQVFALSGGVAVKSTAYFKQMRSSQMEDRSSSTRQCSKCLHYRGEWHTNLDG